MVHMDEGAIRAAGKLKDAFAEISWGSSGEESEEEGENVDEPNAFNVINDRPLSPTPAHLDIPARYLPLIRAIGEALARKRGFSQVEWRPIEMELHEKHSFTPYFESADDCLESCAKEIGFVGYSTNKLGNIDQVWSAAPKALLDSSKIEDVVPSKEEMKASMIFWYGTVNLTEQFCKDLLRTSTASGTLVDVKVLDDQPIMPLRKLIPMLQSRGLLVEWKEIEGQDSFVSVKKCSTAQQKGILRKALSKQFPKAGKLNTKLLEKQLWESDPNVFLACHTVDMAKIVNIAKEQGDYVKLTSNGTQVLWTE